MGTFCLIGMISLQLTIQNGDKAFAYSHTASQSESIDGAIKTGLVTAGNQSDIGILKVYVPNNAIILLAYIGSGNTFSALGIMCGAATGTIQSIEYKVNVYYYRYNFSGEITSSWNGESFGVNPSSPGFPGVWGHVFTNNGNRYGTATGDNYYLIITAAGGLLIGTQVNNSTTITWYSATVTPL